MKSLAALRKNAGYTQQEFGKRLGVGQSTVAMWEAEASWPPARILPKIAVILNCSIDDLFTDIPA